MNKLNQEELLELTKDSFKENRMNLRSLQYDILQEELNERMDKLNTGEGQIMALIKKPQVTEEWIEDKAIKLSNWSAPRAHTLEECLDFIRSLVGEIRGK